jgi:methoxymalonate biosynthesis acyl carrier protein
VTDDARQKIRSFITGRFPRAPLTDELDIFELGFVNSLFAMELVMFIENTFQITIPNEDLTLDNFRTVALMSALVQRQRTAAAQSASP